MISTVEITDGKAFADYMNRTQAIASKYGAELLFRGKATAALAGDQPGGTLIVAVRFPNMAALLAWNRSPEYAEIVPLREEASRQVMTAYSETA